MTLVNLRTNEYDVTEYIKRNGMSVSDRNGINALLAECHINTMISGQKTKRY
jgi:hypothetical protein